MTLRERVRATIARQWCWLIKRGERKVFSEQTYTTPDEAALAAFDEFEAA